MSEHRAPVPLTVVVAPRPPSSVGIVVLATLGVVGALWVGQRFMIPLVAGVLLAMLLGRPVARAGRVLHSRALATVLALALFVAALGLAATQFGGQLARVAERMPEMISLAAQRLTDADASAPTVVSRAREALRELDLAADRWADVKAEVKRETTSTRSRRAVAAAAAATPASGPTPFSDGATVALKQTAVSGSSALLKLAGDLTLILFIAFFVLAGGPLVSERFVDLWADPAARARADHALTESTHQVRLYVGVLALTNLGVGLVVWALFAAVGLPDAGGWGVAAAILHVVPYVGMAVLTGLGAAETFLALGTLGSALAMAAALIAISTVLGTLVTAWLQGRAAKMNAAAVFVGLVFWGAIWGLWGLFLGPVLVVLMKVVAEHSRSGQRLARLMQA